MHFRTVLKKEIPFLAFPTTIALISESIWDNIFPLPGQKGAYWSVAAGFAQLPLSHVHFLRKTTDAAD